MKKHMITLLSLTSALFGAGLQASECNEGLYVGGFGGVNIMQDFREDGMKFKTERGPPAGASIGYKFGDIRRAQF